MTLPIRSVRIRGFMSHADTLVEFPSEGLILVGGRNGCLRGDTVIYDPVALSHKTVQERHRDGVGFHVWAMGPHGPVIAAAMPPQKYEVTPMLRVTMKSGASVVVTPNHRFLSSNGWVRASAVYEQLDDARMQHENAHCTTCALLPPPLGSVVDAYALPKVPVVSRALLLSTSDSALSSLQLGGTRWTQIALGSPADCPSGHHSDGAQLLLVLGNDIAPAPSQVDALAHSRDQLPLSEDSLPCLLSDPPSKSHCAPLEHHVCVSYHQPSVCSRPRADLMSLRQQQSQQETTLARTERAPCSDGQLSNSVCTLPFSSPRYVFNHTAVTRDEQVVSASMEAPEAYYDFHVPIFNNYWACGMWHHNSGKSAIAEAISFCLWGTTIRGETPWADNANGEVTVTMTNGAWVTRKQQTAVKGRIVFARDASATPVVHATVTKAQEELNTLIGEWETWRRAACFTSVDAASFSTATDAERKKLLEHVLGLDVLAEAHDKCRGALAHLRMLEATAKARVQAQRERVAMSQDQCVYAQSRIDAARAIVPVGSVSADNLRASIAASEKVSKGLQQDLNKLLAARQAAMNAQHVYISELHKAEFSHAQALAYADKSSVSKCGECGQTIPDAVSKVAYAKQRVDLQRSVLSDAQAKLAACAPITPFEEEMEEINTFDLEVRERLRTLQASLNEAVRHEAITSTAMEEAQASLDRANASLKDAQDAFAIAEVDVARCAHEKAILETSEKVLGLRGVRAQVLARAIPGFVQATNAWLDAISGGTMSIAIGAEEKNGVIETLPMRVEGKGNGYGYKATSQGERRRVDVALVLGLAEMASGFTIGSAPSTLFFDEVADSLDAVGIERMAEVLQQLSQTRCVVLISHNTTLLDAVKPTKRWTVNEGKVSVQ